MDIRTTAGRHFRPKFDPDALCVVAKDDLLWPSNGGHRVIKPGEPFDWRALGCDRRTAEQLYRVKKIAMVLGEDGRTPRKADAKPSLSARHRGFGRWVVLDELGQVVADKLTRAEAEARASS